MKKKIISLILVLVLVLSLNPVNVWAEGETTGETTEVATFDELKQAIADNKSDIVVTADIKLTEELKISTSSADITVRSKEGSVLTLTRAAETTKSEVLFNITKGKLTFKNITIDGDAENIGSLYSQAVMVGRDASFTLDSGATIQNCAVSSHSGAAIYSSGEVIMNEGSAILNCTCKNNGGAIWMGRSAMFESDLKYFATFTMNGGTISGCSTTSVYGSNGGAVCASGNVKINLLGGTIENNSATGKGGGIYVEPYVKSTYATIKTDASLTIKNCAIKNNTTQKSGGGIYFGGDTLTVGGTVDITGNSNASGTDNVCLGANKVITADGLNDASHIGLSADYIPSDVVTGSENTDVFTSDRVDSKLTAENGGIRIEAAATHEHCICGRTDCTKTGSGHYKITCIGISSLDLVKANGSYCLLNDVYLSENWTAPSGVTLCLNGYAVHAAGSKVAITVSKGSFNLTDCGETGKVTASPWNATSQNYYDAGGVVVAKNATFNLYNGSICDNSAENYQDSVMAGGVEVNGTFNMYGGSVKNNQGGLSQASSSKPYTGGVLVNSTGVFNMYGGEISGNRSCDSDFNWENNGRHGGGVYISGGKFNMSDGVIKNNIAGVNKSPSDGGGVYVTGGGVFTMTGGEISGNTAIKNGGGVYVNNGTFTMSGDAKVTGNSTKIEWGTTEHKGGGVYVANNGKFIMNGNASVEANTAYSRNDNEAAPGGGVYIAAGGVFTMNDNAAVKNNTATSTANKNSTTHGGGVYVAGTLNLNSGTITGNNAHCAGGGIYFEATGTVNLGTGKITVNGNTTLKNVNCDAFLAGETKLTAPAAPAAGSEIKIALPLSRIQKTDGSAIITNTGRDIDENDSRFPFELSGINLVRSEDDLLVKLPVHEHDGIIYIPVDDLSNIPAGGGNYYLIRDNPMAKELTIASDKTVNVCLNGHKNSRTKITNSGTLNITDCKYGTKDEGYISGNTGYNNNYPIDNAAKSTLNMKNVSVKESEGNPIIRGQAKASITIENCNFENNTAKSLYISGAETTVTNCTFKNNGGNVAGGAVIFAERNTNYSMLTIKDCVFEGNHTTSGNSSGGAINYESWGGLLLDGCTFTGNSATGVNAKGGALYTKGKELTIKDCTFTENTAGWKGGAIYSESLEPVFTGKVIVKKNTSKDIFYTVDGEVENNVDLGEGNVFVTDSGFNASASSIGITSDTVPALVVKNKTNTAGFFCDNSDFYLKPTDSGLEIWHSGKNHKHCVCGTGQCNVDGHSHKTEKWIGVTTLRNLPAGNYFLLSSVNEQWEPKEDINLCLNGKGIYSSTSYNDGIITISNKNNIAVTDCSENETGNIYDPYSSNSGRGVWVASDASFTLWRGKIRNVWANTSSYASSGYYNGGGVYVTGGKFTMNGGSISKATSYKGNGGGVYVDSGEFIMNGGTITGCKAVNGGAVYFRTGKITLNGGAITNSKATENGGGVYINSVSASSVWDSSSRNYIYTYVPAAINNVAITGNSAVIGGGMYVNAPTTLNGTAITGNTATERGAGAAFMVPSSYKRSNYINYDHTLAGSLNISGNKVGEDESNLYLKSGALLPLVSGVSEGAAVGVLTQDDPLKDNGGIEPVYISNDLGATDRFTSDKGYEVKADEKKNQLYIIAESYTVDITLGEGMTSSGTLSQMLLKGADMAEVVVAAEDGYYFPADYADALSQNGVNVTVNSTSKLTISGKPAGDVALILPAATAKSKPAAPTGLLGLSPTGWEATDGKIMGTTADMEWSADNITWNDCSDGVTVVGAEGTYYVRMKATDISYVSDATNVTVPRYLKGINFPTPETTEFIYDGEEHTLIPDGEGYNVSGKNAAADAGSYSASVELKDGYKWTGAYEASVDWTISRRTAAAEDFTFRAPENTVWDGGKKEATVSVNAPMSLGACTSRIVYKSNGKEVENPTDPGTYQVYLVITGEGNFLPAEGLTSDSWTFVIGHPAEHIWGEWQHDEKSHWHNCTVPGCSETEKFDHETTSPATCHKKAVCSVCGNEYGKLDAHNHTDVVNTAYKAPTCGGKGNEAYSFCSGCNKYFSGKAGDAALYDSAEHFDIAPLNHKNVVKTEAIAADCYNGGNKAYWQCTDCHNYFADNNGKADLLKSYDNESVFDTEPLKHANAVKTAEKPATCTEGGNKAYWYCPDCKTYPADNNGTPNESRGEDSAEAYNTNALGHEYTSEVVGEKHLKSAATCTEDAVYYKSCVRCGKNGTETFTKENSALGHEYTNYVYNDDATYDEDGTETAACNHGCGTTDTRTKTGSKLIDSTAPEIKGVENGKSYCISVEISVSDMHLETVTLNGEEVVLEDGKLTVTGMDTEQILTASDRFGNVTTVKFTVNAEHTPDEGKITTAPTAAKEGERTFCCTICGQQTGKEPVSKIAPTIIEGANGKYTSGGKDGLTFRSDAAFEDFIKVMVDGSEIEESCYSLSEGSIVVTLTSAYLNTLSVGKHTLDVVSAFGTASTEFTIAAAPASTEITTGDNSNAVLWILTAVISLIAVALAVIICKKRKRD